MFNIYDEAIRSTELPKRVWLCLTAFFSRAIRPWHTLVQQVYQQQQLVGTWRSLLVVLSTLSSPFQVFPRQPTSGIPTTHQYSTFLVDNWCTQYVIHHCTSLSGLLVSHVSLFLFTNATTPVKYVVEKFESHRVQQYHTDGFQMHLVSQESHL